jgi:hypothetical protein
MGDAVKELFAAIVVPYGARFDLPLFRLPETDRLKDFH